MSGLHRWTWCFILAFCILVQGRVDTISNLGSPAQYVRIGTPFGAETGAIFNVSLNVRVLDGPFPENWFYLVLFTDAQVSPTSYYDSAENCILPSIMRYEFSDSISITRDIPQTDRYHLYLLNCQEKEVDINATVVWVNPGSQISLEEQPLFYCYLVLFVLFVCVALNCVLHVIRFRRGLLAIHMLLLVYIFLSSTYLGLNVAYYAEYSKYGQTTSWIAHKGEIIGVLSEGVFLGSLLLIAMGWNIVRTRLSARNKQLLWAAVLLFTGFNLAYSLCIYPENLCAVYMLFFHVIKFLITFAIVVAINAECEQLRSEFSPNHTGRNIIAKKLVMFHRLRWTFFILLIVPILMIFFDYAVLAWQEAWISIMVNQALYLIVFCEVAIVLRPRKHGQNVYFLDSRPQLPIAPIPVRDPEPANEILLAEIAPEESEESGAESDPDLIADLELGERDSDNIPHSYD